ncbi:MAG TPA: 3-hydroxyacyl-CoA dehydrogenase NAD-binding domain-containing protein [Caldimonas sp.]|jgi:3-hydroxyacyl-CoA dehydrogenase/enoyl-CoA hydratase/3-hydroxybutyryl-CoA epimerase|nr:3-hydroxyacyl-CoA dehydrogenase NAD-binding domain-containing protein [Caldimonas sp.]HEX2540233.1 3-hydroxyacyl-CoA dehydrogenase NAD-binding domain-containing protein [Caldimonas sp.]
MQTLRYELDGEGIATITFDAPGSPVNTMTPEWQRDLAAAAAQAQADRERIQGVLLVSAKSTFFAGAALKSLLTLREEDAASSFVAIEAMKASFRKLETLGRPVVTLLAGSALGGGWEVALIGHARFALDDPKIQFGTPEVSLGLIPGGTGITKTVRKLGLMAARPYLLEGRLFGPREARELGWVQGLCGSVDQMREQALAWIAAHPDATQPWDRRDYRMPGGTPSDPKIAAALSVAPAMLAQQTRGLHPAPQAVLEAMVEGALVDYDTATRIESRKLARVMVGQTARNMISAFFFDLNAIKSGQARPRGFDKWRPAKVGVLGAGMMGAGIAHANASRGMACVLKDVSAEKAAAGVDAVRRITGRQVSQGRMDPLAEAALLGLIAPTADAGALDGCDLIIEAVFENRELKARVTREAEPMLAPGGIFASNTSTLPIGGLAEASARPERFVGLHFFSPVHRMRLVEIIRGARTGDETLARAYDYVLAIGKTPIVVNDSRGFFTSRVFGTYVMEGAAMLAEGIAAPLIEHAAVAAGMPVGPLAVLDETSLSLSVHVMEQARADAAAEGRSVEPTPGEALVERMVKELGRPGRAGGGGFYDYPDGQPKRLWPGLRQHFEKLGVDADPAELKQRFLYRQSIETARCLAEGVLTSVHEANIGSIFGIGFPAWTGGAIRFIDSEGRERFLATADALARRHGERFAVSADVRSAIPT